MKLSVIIPVYNMEPWLDECLGSLRSQTFLDWETICVDDGSADGSRAVLEKFAAEDARFQVIGQENRGVSAARNVALEAARGKWIAFVDADDTLGPDWFEKMMRHAADGVELIHADSGFCLNDGRSAEPGSYRTFLRDGWPWLNVVRKSAIGDVRFRTGMKLKEDVIFFTELARKTDRIAWVQEKGYHYRRREDSAVHARVKDEDSVRFYSELKALDLPREDVGRAIGYDLVQWVRNRDQKGAYDAAKCPVLDAWRAGIAEGSLRYGDVRCWWRPGLWWWIKTGRIGLLVFTRKLRLRVEGWTRGEKWVE